MKSLRTTVAAGALAVTLVACGGGGGDSGGNSDSQRFADGKTFTMVLGSDPGKLDPHFTSLSVTLQTNRFLYDSLVSIDEKGNMVAGLAARWEGSTTKATFTLRKGVTCANGDPLTAADVAANINFVGDPKNASSGLGLYVPPEAKATADEATGAVTVTSPTPDAFLERNVGRLPIVCAKGMKNRDMLKRGADGTGMFKLTEAVTDDHYTMTRRTDYAWGPGEWKKDQEGLPDKVVLKIVGNETTAANLLMSGQVNVATITGPDSRRLASQELFVRDVRAPLGELWFNQKAGLPGADEAVRRALTQALDLERLGQVLTSGTGKPSTGLVAPGLGPCDGNTVGSSLPDHDVEAAKSALDDAGWTVGPGGVRTKDGKKLSMDLYFVSKFGSPMRAGVELMQKVWKGIGVDVTTKGLSDAEVGQVIVGGEGTWHAAILRLGLTLPSEAVPFFSGPAAPDGTNFASVDNDRYTAAVKEASAIAGQDGCGKWGEAERALFENVDIVPFVDSANQAFARGARFEFSEGSVLPGSVRMLG